MNEITKVSEITPADIWEFLNPSEEMDSGSETTINNLIGIATAFIKNWTGLDDLDTYQDFVIVVFVLCQDMWDNRSLYVDKSNLNKVVESILGLHQVNLL